MALHRGLLDAYCIHLSKEEGKDEVGDSPEETTRTKLAIMSFVGMSFVGIGQLDSSISSHSTLAMKFLQAWPNIFRWMKHFCNTVSWSGGADDTKVYMNGLNSVTRIVFENNILRDNDSAYTALFEFFVELWLHKDLPEDY